MTVRRGDNRRVEGYEWISNRDLIDSAHLLMGNIDLDPASSEFANGYVGADKFFTAKDDPINEARARALKALGRDPFMEHQLPQAVIALKQGVGRLIRDADDRGVVVLCDPRLLSKAYGRVFIGSLPPMPVCRDIEDVVGFFAHP